VYGLDFAGGGLDVLDVLPHCGAVVRGDNPSLVERLFAFLSGRIDRAPDVGAAPRTIVLLDGYHGFASAFERVDLGRLVDELPRMVSAGRSRKVHFLITAERRSGVPSSIASVIPSKLILRMADADEYSALGVRLSGSTRDAPGRMVVPPAMDAQSAAPPDLTRIARSASERWPGSKAPPILPMPSDVESSALTSSVGPDHALIGVREDLGPAMVSLEESNLLIAGPYGGGRTTAINTIVDSLRASTPGCRAYLVSQRPGAGASIWDAVVSTESGARDLLESLDVEVDPKARTFVFVDDAEDIPDAVASVLERLVKRSRDGGIRVVAAAEVQSVQRTFGGWLSEIRKDKTGLLLAPQLEIDGELLGVRLPRRSTLEFPPGRGYLIERGRIGLVQVARSA
jgi:S-DNA-T family DNA segregation ATPase FtsK/SpoIIIE